jgi:hypothetical protein
MGYNTFLYENDAWVGKRIFNADVLFTLFIYGPSIMMKNE